MAELSDPTHGPHRVGVVDPDRDVDGNGVPETVVVSTESPLAGVLHDVFGDAEVGFLSDYDGDGFADHVTTFEDDGSYSSWQLASGDDASWSLTDRGSL